MVKALLDSKIDGIGPQWYYITNVYDKPLYEKKRGGGVTRIMCQFCDTEYAEMQVEFETKSGGYIEECCCKHCWTQAIKDEKSITSKQ